PRLEQVRLVRFELTRPQAHVLTVVRLTKLRHSRIDSASWIRTSSIPSFKPRWSASCLSRHEVAGDRFELSARLGLSKSGRPIAYPATSTHGKIRTFTTHVLSVVTPASWSTWARVEGRGSRREEREVLLLAPRSSPLAPHLKRRVSVSTRYFLFDRQVCT